MKGRILLVDDNVNLTTLLSKALSKCGYETFVVNDSPQAVETVRRFQPDLVLLDVMMPEMDGGDVLSELRADFSLREIPVILLTALAREAGSLTGIGGGNCPLIGKPVELGVLVSEIERTLGREAVGA